VGTLAVAGCPEILDHLRKMIVKAGRRPFIISIGKLSPAKLGNFLEVDVFVLIACAQQSVIDCKEFLQPVLTPLELEMALFPSMNPWSPGAYATDFSNLLDRQIDEYVGSGEPVFSLATGTLVSTKKDVVADEMVPSSSSLIRTSSGALITNREHGLSTFLQRRQWIGLEMDSDQSDVPIIQEGNSLL